MNLNKNCMDNENRLIRLGLDLPPARALNLQLNSILQARWFQTVIIAVIILAGVLAGLETSGSIKERYGSALRVLDLLVLAVFVVEIALKMAVHGRRPWRYFREGWNVFDFLIVAVCCLPLDSQFASVFRLARGLRLLRLISVLPKLQLLVGALLKSLGAMGYVTILLVLVFYVYGVAGVHLFSQSDPKHFGSLSTAMLSLFRVITLDNWSDIFLAASAASRLAAVIYFVSFIMLGTMIMLNLFIGIIMNSMSEMHGEMEERERAGRAGEKAAGAMEEELRALEQQAESLREQVGRLRNHVRRNP
jgi:voltage-gated sodium channel